jgi:hypothetical protein
MKRIRFIEEQIIAVLREHEAGAKTADLTRTHGISEAGCETSFSMKVCSSISTRSAKSSVPGSTTTTPPGHSSLGYKTPAAYAGTLIAPKGVIGRDSNRRTACSDLPLNFHPA